MRLFHVSARCKQTCSASMMHSSRLHAAYAWFRDGLNSVQVQSGAGAVFRQSKKSPSWQAFPLDGLIMGRRRDVGCGEEERLGRDRDNVEISNVAKDCRASGGVTSQLARPTERMADASIRRLPDENSKR